MRAVLLGSISTLADTSELQRAAFNNAFAAHGLDWRWEVEDYRAMLATSGGEQRIAEQASERGQDVDAAAVHATKSRLFQESLATADLSARDGVLSTVAAAEEAGIAVALVTTTSPDNVAALLGALAPEVDRTTFDVVLDASDVERPKPDPAVYLLALERLGLAAGECVAVEDNEDGVAAAAGAGVACAAFPNANTAGHAFSAAALRVQHLDLRALERLSA